MRLDGRHRGPGAAARRCAGARGKVADRRPAREAAARRRRGELARRHGRRERVHRRVDAVHRRDAGRSRSPSMSRTTVRVRTASRPETGSPSGGARTARSSSTHWRTRNVMTATHVPTSCAAPRPAAPSSPLPGLLAACGGGSKSAATTAAGGRRRRCRRRSSARTGRSTSTSTRRRRRTRRSTRSRRSTGVKVTLHRGHQRQRLVLREDPGAALAGPVDRPRHHRADRLLGPARRG